MNSTSSTKQEFKTPSYVRKASNNYYQRLRADPEKYKEYLEKRRNYNRKKALEKKQKKEEMKEKLMSKATSKSTEIFPHYDENYNPSTDNSSCED